MAPDEKYEVKRCVEEAAIIVTSVAEPKITVTVTLTSPVMRESNTEANAAGGRLCVSQEIISSTLIHF